MLSPTSVTPGAETTGPRDQAEDAEGMTDFEETADPPTSAVPREKLVNFLERECTRSSLNLVQLALDCWGDYESIVKAARALEKKGKGLGRYNAWTYTRARAFLDALTTYGWGAGLRLGSGSVVAVRERQDESPEPPSSQP